ncbi:hypothetical protein IWW54_001095 [Coemansia sp. RSA 2705]|nr:hypothetical protein IWW54_001095 [Coemansia sp. RSA 2705]
MGAPESANGVVTSVFGAGSVVASLIAGVLSDRLQSRRGLQIFGLVNGAASGIACTLLYATLGDVYPANLLGFKVAIIYFCNDIAYTIGPICGQRLFNIAGVKGPASVVIALGVLKLILLTVVSGDSLVIRKIIRASEEDVEAKGPEVVSVSAEKSMSIPRLLLRPPVIISTLAIMASLGVQGMLEGLVPLHLIDKLNRLNDNGISFVILGLAFTVLVPIVGKVNDTLISRWDERMRYCLMLFGSLAMILAMVLMALAKTYAVLMVGFAFFALTNLCMCIPAQSAYGDFINSGHARGIPVALIDSKSAA